MALSTPAAMSLVGDAVHVRHVHRPLVGRSSAVWATQRQPGIFRFVMRDITQVLTQPYGGASGFFLDGTDFSDVVLPVEVVGLTGFHVLVRSDGQLVFLFSDTSGRVRRFRFDPAALQVVGSVDDVFSGAQPSLVPASGNLFAFFLENDGILRRASLDDGITWSGQLVALQPSLSRIETFDVHPKSGVTSAHYVGDHVLGPGSSAGIALPLSQIANTTLLLGGAPEIGNITEAIPAGAVSYWTMDSAHMSGSTILDQVGANNPFLEAGTNQAAPGQVGGAAGARVFDGATRWRVNNTVSLQLTGDLTVEWWQNVPNFSARRHPVHKAYGGEYGFTVETDGTVSFYCGSGGGDVPPYQYFPMPVPMRPGRWYHLCIVRDAAARTLRWYLDGRLVNQDTLHATPAISANPLYVGYGYTGNHWVGQLDQMAIYSSALGPEQVRNNYEKGVADKRLDASNTAAVPRFAAVFPAALKARPGVFPAQPVPARNGTGLAVPSADVLFLDPGSYANLAGLAGMTVEWWGVPGAVNPSWPPMAPRAVPGSRVLDSMPTDGTLTGITAQPGWRCGNTTDGRIFFQFHNGSGATPMLLQVGGPKLRQGRSNYAAVSHQFGIGSTASFLVVNGVVVPSQWVLGTGNETVTGGAGTGMVLPLSGGTLDSIRVLSVARTAQQLGDYFRGVAL